MKKAAIVTIASIAIAAAGVGTVTAVMQTNSTRSAVDEVIATPSTDTEPSQDRPDTNPPDSASERAQVPAQSGDNPNRLTQAEYERLRDFPHQPIELTDQVEPGSEFAQFRQRFRQAVRDRDREFIRPLLPMTEQGLPIGFGFASLEDVGFDQPDGWIWSVLEKTISQGCASMSAESYGYPEAESPVWICPNTTVAFEQQYPAPPDATGIDQYIDHVIVVGENVNVRAEPTTEGAVVGILSNEVVEASPEGWERLQQRLGDQRPDPIAGWTPVRLPNGKEGYVYSRYAYAPLDPRLMFAKMNGQWQIVRIPAGD